jgi:SAM-dependent methyltransferase
LNLVDLERLQTPEGRAALADADALEPDEKAFLGCFGRLSKRHETELARAALSAAILRRRAAAKFSRAGSMFFEREALEQSSGEPLSARRARRMVAPGVKRVADLCCGLGGDAIALAERAEVIAVDLDPLRLRLCDLNLSAYQRRERARLIEADALTVDLTNVDAVFVDPDRRVDGRRQLSLSACQPPLRDLLRRCPPGMPACAKLAPGVPWQELAELNGEAEFVSLAGELKECVLWLGPYRTVARKATLLPSGDSLSADMPAPSPGCAAPGRYLYDPDPAVVRAALVTDLAHLLQARQLDAEIAYLSGDAVERTPFARTYVVEESLPFHLGRLRELLRARGVGRVSVQRRGSPVDPDELVRKLKLRGEESRTIILTRFEGRPWVVVAVAQTG